MPGIAYVLVVPGASPYPFDNPTSASKSSCSLGGVNVDIVSASASAGDEEEEVCPGTASSSSLEGGVVALEEVITLDLFDRVGSI